MSRIICVIVFLVLWCFPVASQELGDFGYHHHTFHEWYNKGENGGPIMRPHQPSTKCCEGDCRPVKAKFTSGHWFVYVDRIWVKVPPERIKVGIVPPEKPFRSAHVCASKYNGKDLPEIYCFILNETES